MFCPECEDEFRDGFFRCPDCHVALVAELHKEPEPNHPESVELLRTANVPFLSVVKSLLDAEAIPYSVQGEEALRLLTVLPSSHSASPASFGVRVFVPADRYEAALALVESASVEGDAY
jgi:hypothetical protein